MIRRQCRSDNGRTVQMSASPQSVTNGKNYAENSNPAARRAGESDATIRVRSASRTRSGANNHPRICIEQRTDIAALSPKPVQDLISSGIRGLGRQNPIFAGGRPGNTVRSLKVEQRVLLSRRGPDSRFQIVPHEPAGISSAGHGRRGLRNFPEAGKDRPRSPRAALLANLAQARSASARSSNAAAGSDT